VIDAIAPSFATADQGALADSAIQLDDPQLVPGGGATGQVLAKAGPDNYSTVWSDAGAGDMTQTTWVGSGSDFSVDPGKLAKRQDVAVAATEAGALADFAALTAMSSTNTVALVKGKPGGRFTKRSGDYSSTILGDPDGDIYVPVNGDAARTSGIWEKQPGLYQHYEAADASVVTSALQTAPKGLANYAQSSIKYAYSKHPKPTRLINYAMGHFVVYPVDGGDCSGWAPALYINDNATTARAQPYSMYYELPQEREGTPKLTARQGIKGVGVGDTVDLVADRIEWEGDFSTNDPTLLRPIGYGSSNPLLPDYNQPAMRLYGRAVTLDPFNYSVADDGINGNPKVVSDISSAAVLTVAVGHGFVPGDRLWLYGQSGTQTVSLGRGFVVGTSSSTSITLRTLKPGYLNTRMDSAVTEYSDAFTDGASLYVYRDNTPRIRRAHWWVGLHLPGRSGDQRSGTIQSRHIVGSNYENDGKYSGIWEFLVSPLGYGEEKPAMYLRPWEELSTGNTPLSVWFSPTGGVGSAQERRVKQASASSLGVGSSVQALIFGGGGNISASTTAYMGYGVSSTSSSNVQAIPVPFAGTLRNLRIRTSGSISPGTWTVTVEVNGSTTLIATNVTTTTGTNLVNTVSVAAGDTVRIIVVADANAVARTGIATLELAYASGAGTQRLLYLDN
jgi:hypothetical protein